MWIRDRPGNVSAIPRQLSTSYTGSRQVIAMALGAAATAAGCFSSAASSVSRCRIRAQAKSWAGGAEELVRSGAVKAVRPRDAAEVLGAEGFRLLDVRPAWEHSRAAVRGSVHVPLFVADDDMGPVTLLKKWVHLGYIGLWTGQSFTKMNDRFLYDVAAAVAGKDAKVLVACGEGLRSLIAVRMLHDGGYKNVAWLAGGFSKSVDGDFADVEGESKLRYATIGGVSYIFLQILLLLRVVS